MELLKVENLKTYYNTKNGYNQAVDGVSFTLNTGEMLGLIGESGCGKSTVGYSLINMIDYPGQIMDGSVKLDNTDILKLDEDGIRGVLWEEIAMIPQSAMNALNPTHKIGKQIMEAVLLHNKASSKSEAERKARELLVSVGIDEKWFNSYPHNLSGGMKQRVIIAMALSCEPKILISDESTTGLDVLIQAQILALLKDLQIERGIGIILISHDLHMVKSICDRIGIMYGGKMVEIGTVEDISENPEHPYTKALFDSQIHMDSLDTRPKTIDGVVPKLINPKERCRFYSRCCEKTNKCEGVEPEFKDISKTHAYACWKAV